MKLVDLLREIFQGVFSAKAHPDNSPLARENLESMSSAILYTVPAMRCDMMIRAITITTTMIRRSFEEQGREDDEEDPRIRGHSRRPGDRVVQRGEAGEEEKADQYHAERQGYPPGIEIVHRPP